MADGKQKPSLRERLKAKSNARKQRSMDRSLTRQKHRIEGNAQAAGGSNPGPGGAPPGIGGGVG